MPKRQIYAIVGCENWETWSRDWEIDFQELIHLWKNCKNVCQNGITTAERYLDSRRDMGQPQIEIYGRRLVFQMANPQSTLGG